MNTNLRCRPVLRVGTPVAKKKRSRPGKPDRKPVDRKDISVRRGEDEGKDEQLARILRAMGGTPEPSERPAPPAGQQGRDQRRGGGRQESSSGDQAREATKDWAPFDPDNLIIPKTIASAVRTQPFSELNFRLLFHHYLPATRGKLDGREQGGQSQALLNALASGANHSYHDDDQGVMLNAFREQTESAVRDYCALWGWSSLTVELQSSMIVGMGLPSQFENGMSLHHLTGAPVIPSSALKGLAKAAALQELAEEFGIPWVDRITSDKRPTPYDYFAELLDWAPPVTTSTDAQREAARRQLAQQLTTLRSAVDEVEGVQFNVPDDPVAWEAFASGQGEDQRIAWYRLGFGAATEEGGRGCVMFSDALPLPEGLKLEPGLLNPHGTLDWSDPIPIAFLTVAAGSRFTSVLGSLGPDQDGLRRQLVTWLTDGARNLGIGARTFTGHGTAKITGQDHPSAQVVLKEDG